MNFMANLAQLRLNTAIVYHMPGASMKIKAGDDTILVAPTSEVRADLHPGDIRDLVSMCIRNSSMSPLHNGLNINPDDEIEMEVTQAPGLFESVGAGLYLVTPPGTRSVYCFPTLLLPADVEKVIREVSQESIPSTIDYDEALCVTLATFEKRLIEGTTNSFSTKGGIVGEILAECAIAEEFASMDIKKP